MRCASVEEGSKRIYQSLQHYAVAHAYDASRVIPVPGDVARPMLGLSPTEFARLASTVDAIYHNAAVVNWLYTYAQLKPTNVLGTQEIIRLAAHHKRKPLHFVSTVAACPLEDTFDVTIVNERQ